MKKITLLMAGCLCLTVSFSQVRTGGASLNPGVAKGAKLVGVGIGAINYTNSENSTEYSNTPTVYNSDGNSFSISVYPNVAWFVKDRLAVGGGISLSMYTSTSKISNTGSSNTSESKYNQPSVYIGPFARYYFGGSSKGMPFTQLNVQVGIAPTNSKTETSTGASSETKGKTKGDWNSTLYFGYEHFISSYVGLYGSIGFSYGSSKTTYEYRPSTGTGYDYTSTYSRFYIPVTVGLQVHIPGNGKNK